MKKLLLLAGILVVGAASYALDLDPMENNKTLEDLKVTATVVEDVTVKTEDVQFGEVAAGMKNLDPKVAGHIKVEQGVPKAKVAISLHRYGLIDEGKQIDVGEAVNLVSTAGLGTTPLEYTPNFSNQIYTLDKNGSLDLKVTGKLDVPDRAWAGEYSTTLKVKVSYSEFAKN